MPVDLKPLEFFPISVVWGQTKAPLEFQRSFTAKYRARVPPEMLGRNDNLTYAPSLAKYSVAKNNLGSPGTSQISAYLFDMLAAMFGLPGGTCLDPFCGSFERGIICRDRNMSYLGIDIRPEQIDANNQAMALLGGAEDIIYIVADARQYLPAEGRKFDFVLTCPPYYTLERYSKLPGDLSNMDFAEYNTTIGEIVGQCIEALNDDRFAVFVVGNCRDKQGRIWQANGPIISAAMKAGAVFYNELVYVRPYGTASFRGPMFFRASRKLCTTHEYALIFYKGDPKKIKENFIRFT